jgi:UDP-glucuronate 4-epimerase
MKILVTGCAGFIGMHVARRLLERGDMVLGVDNLNNYYNPALKTSRLSNLLDHSTFTFKLIDIADREAIFDLFARERFDRVVHMAAQAGVRYSIENPHAFVDSNLLGFINILEGCRINAVRHLVYASSSSVYGNNQNTPFSESEVINRPISLYAATKAANELMAYSYSHLYGIPTTGLRFFTVYGPWGRPDMSPWLFTSAIMEGRPIKVFNYGNMQRDFTFIDDIVEGTLLILDKAPERSHPLHPNGEEYSTDSTPAAIFNIGNHNPIKLMDFINTIEKSLGKVAIKNYLPIQAGDVRRSFADVTALANAVGFTPRTSLSDGIASWVSWYKTAPIS